VAGAFSVIQLTAMPSRHLCFFVSLSCFVALAGCSGDEEDGGSVPANCSTDEASNEDEGEQMRPGGNCIDCHRSEDEGPSYTIAGTVMGAYHDDERCVGVGGVTVEVTGADGKVISMSTNSVGNFFYTGNVATPYTAKVITAAGERPMAAPQTDTNCANCHTAEGTSSAPGRILAP
jgi:mono/diheme cytochrome c family protein